MKKTPLSLAEALGQQLLSKHWLVSTAESCTGGGIAAAITAVPGSSQWFHQSVVTYSNEAKHRMLGVSNHSLETDGAVSQSVVEAMASGILTYSSADITVAVSGIAGPDGGTPEKPVGTVWIGWATKQQVISQCFLFDGDRDVVRQQTIEAALKGLLEILQKNTV